MTAFDLRAYLARIGAGQDVDTTAETLRAVHLAHATHIPFENLDIHLGRPIRVDAESVFDKLVLGGRGGYCFEMNTLFAEAARTIGFPVRALGARPGEGDPRQYRMTHVILAVEAEGTTYLCDVGFGAGGLLEPIVLAEGAEAVQFGWRFRIDRTDYGYVLRGGDPGGSGYEDLYHFTLVEMYPPDVQVANHFTSTSVESGFVRTLTAQRMTTTEQWLLRGRTLTHLRAGESTEVTVAEDDLLDVLAGTFGLRFPPGTTFRSPAEDVPGTVRAR